MFLFETLYATYVTFNKHTVYGKFVKFNHSCIKTTLLYINVYAHKIALRSSRDFCESLKNMIGFRDKK